MGLFSFILNLILGNDNDFDNDFDFDDNLDFDPDVSVDADSMFDSIDAEGLSEYPDILSDIVPETSPVSFTGLIDNGLVESKAFTSWSDGVSLFEITPDRIQEIANHIADEFSQAFPDVKMELFRGGFATTMQGNGTIFYDVADVLSNESAGFGGNNIVGSVAHEMGHNIVERVFSNVGENLSRLEHEIGADYIEGVVFGMTGIDPSEKYAFLRSIGESGPGYLPVEDRIKVIKQGLSWGNQLKLLGTNAPELMVDYNSNDVLMNRLRNIFDVYT